MFTVHWLLLILALLCFLLAAMDVFPPRRGNVMAAGLFLWLLATLVVGK